MQQQGSYKETLRRVHVLGTLGSFQKGEKPKSWSASSADLLDVYILANMWLLALITFASFSKALYSGVEITCSSTSGDWEARMPQAQGGRIADPCSLPLFLLSFSPRTPNPSKSICFNIAPGFVQGHVGKRFNRALVRTGVWRVVFSPLKPQNCRNFAKQS